MSSLEPRLRVGRYLLFEAIASGGMATVYYGRLVGHEGFNRTVAVKQLHPHLAQEASFSAMFLDEARLAARIHHPNVVQTLDVVSDQGVFIVMEYIDGETLSNLSRDAKRGQQLLPFDISVAIVCGMLTGLHAAHEARDESGEPLGIIHRDVSPQNLLIGTDGLPRVLDFGIAKAAHRTQQHTRTGELKGKVAYMSPEQLSAGQVDRRTDVYAAGVVLWETLAGRRLFTGDNEILVANQVFQGNTTPPSAYNPKVPPALDAVALKAIAHDPAQRFDTALQMAEALEAAHPVASSRAVGALVQRLCEARLSKRSAYVTEIERSSRFSLPSGEPPSPTTGPVLTAAPVSSELMSGPVSSAVNPPSAPRAWLPLAATALLAAIATGVAIAGFFRGPAAAPLPVASPPSAAATTAPGGVSAAAAASPAGAPSAAPASTVSAAPSTARSVSPGKPVKAPAKAKAGGIGAEFDDRK